MQQIFYVFARRRLDGHWSVAVMAFYSSVLSCVIMAGDHQNAELPSSPNTVAISNEELLGNAHTHRLCQDEDVIFIYHRNKIINGGVSACI